MTSVARLLRAQTQGWDPDGEKTTEPVNAGPSSKPGSPLAGYRQETELPGAFVRRGAIRRAKLGEGRAGAPSAAPKPVLGSLSQLAAKPAAHYEKRAMPTDAGALARLRCDAQLASFPYKRDPESLPEGWSPRIDLAEKLRGGLGLRSSGIERGAGAIIDRQTGLVAVLLHNHQTREVVLAFGGTTSGKKVKGALAERPAPKGNFMSTLTQWGANICAGIGGTPKSYQQGAALLGSLRGLVATDPAFIGCTVRVVGHSKGGGEAMYASLKSSEPVKVTAFCPAHLSDGLIKQLPAENLSRAKDLIASYSPHGDPIAAMRGKLPGVSGVGIGCHFDGIPGSSAASLHSQFRRHVLHYCDTTSSI